MSCPDEALFRFQAYTHRAQAPLPDLFFRQREDISLLDGPTP